MNVNRLQAVKSTMPGPAPVAPGIDLLRRTFDQDYDRRRAVQLGEISAYGNRHAVAATRRVSGRSAASEPFCGDCGALRSPLATQPCSACGSTQPPNLSRLNPRHRHMAGESPYR